MGRPSFLHQGDVAVVALAMRQTSELQNLRADLAHLAQSLLDTGSRIAHAYNFTSARLGDDVKEGLGEGVVRPSAFRDQVKENAMRLDVALEYLLSWPALVKAPTMAEQAGDSTEAVHSEPARSTSSKP